MSALGTTTMMGGRVPELRRTTTAASVAAAMARDEKSLREAALAARRA